MEYLSQGHLGRVMKKQNIKCLSSTEIGLSGMSKRFREHLSSFFPHAAHIRCVSHIYNLIGKVFCESKTKAPLRQFALHCGAFCKGTRNVHRRQRLRRFLQQMACAIPLPHPITNARLITAATRWDGVYAWVKWMVTGPSV